MVRYIIKRIALFIPSWLAVSVMVFGLSQCTAGDPVADKLTGGEGNSLSPALYDELYRQKSHELGLDRPAFYFTISSAAYPDTLYRIVRRDERQVLSRLCSRFGDWQTIQAYYHSLKKLVQKTTVTEPAPIQSVGGQSWANDLLLLSLQDDPKVINAYLNTIEQAVVQNNILSDDLKAVRTSFNDMIAAKSSLSFLKPTFTWHGFDNQYHRWMSRFLSGHFGISYVDDRLITNKLWLPFGITLLMSGLALLVAYLLAISLGFLSVHHRHAILGKWLMRVFTALYALPTFWTATLAIVFLTTPQYGCKIFPSAGLADIASNVSIGAWLSANIGRLALPVICMALHPTAVLARQFQGALFDTLQMDYIRTARAKGLSEWQVLRQHAFKNAAFPLITYIGQLLPSLIGGSFAVEYVFNIPGMGRAAFDAIFARDWQVVYAVILLGAALVLVGNLLSDILYRRVNPRVTF